MTVLLGLLLTGVVFALASAISGIQSIHTDHTGVVITYWHGYGRLLALAYAAVLGLAFYGIYRRYPIVWKLGFVVWWLVAVDCIFNAWRLLLPQPYGWSVRLRSRSSRLSLRYTGQIGGADRKIGLSDVEKNKPNQTMKPTALPRNEFSVFATTPCGGLSLSR